MFFLFSQSKKRPDRVKKFKRGRRAFFLFEKTRRMEEKTLLHRGQKRLDPFTIFRVVHAAYRQRAHSIQRHDRDLKAWFLFDGATQFHCDRLDAASAQIIFFFTLPRFVTPTPISA